MRKKFALLLAALAALFLLSGCKVSGNPLPEGMEGDTVLEQGREIVALLNGGDWQEVYQSYMEERLEKAGAFKEEDEAFATGQKIKETGEEYGTAVLYCKHEKKSVMYRIAYSTGMELMGIEVTVR